MRQSQMAMLSLVMKDCVRDLKSNVYVHPL